MKRQLAVFTAILLAPVVLQAAVYTLYDGATGDIDADTSAWDATRDFTESGTGVVMIENIAPPTPFNDGNAMSFKNMVTTDKPELQGEVASLAGGPLTDAFRVDFQSYNNSSNYAGSEAIRFRMANSGKSITSESRSAFSVSWQSDGRINGKYSDHGLNDGVANDVDTKSFSVANDNLNLYKVIDVTIIGNAKETGTYSYSLFGESRTLNPQSYDLYVDDGSGWVLVNSGSDPWYANGLSFHLEKSAAEYDPALGIGRFGLVGSSDSNSGTQMMYDNILLKTGADVIPEPATLGLLGISGVFMFAARRLRRK